MSVWQGLGSQITIRVFLGWRRLGNSHIRVRAAPGNKFRLVFIYWRLFMLGSHRLIIISFVNYVRYSHYYDQLLKHRRYIFWE